MSTPNGGKLILKLDDIHTYYGTIHALKGISIEVRDGEIVTLIGANGAGKSTTLRSINGLNHPREGTIEFQGKDITNEAPHEIVKMGISQSPEGRRVFSWMSVLENLEMGAYRETTSPASARISTASTTFPAAAGTADAKADLRGEQQMLAIGRALFGAPEAPSPRRAVHGAGADLRRQNLR